MMGRVFQYAASMDAWVAEYYFPGELLQRSFKTKEDAEEWLSEKEKVGKARK